MVATRAVETGRPVARAANTGVSAFIDPVGRVFDATDVGIVPSDSLAVSAAELTGPEWRMAALPLMEGDTPYVVIGDVPAYLAALFAALAGLVALGPPAPPPDAAPRNLLNRHAHRPERTNQLPAGAPGRAPGASLTSTASGRGSR